jgi:hypothetical protein
MVNEQAMWQAFLRSLPLLSASIIPPIFRIFSFICNRRCKTLTTLSFVKQLTLKKEVNYRSVLKIIYRLYIYVYVLYAYIFTIIVLVM